jgi:hypothetical protein
MGTHELGFGTKRPSALLNPRCSDEREASSRPLGASASAFGEAQPARAGPHRADPQIMAIPGLRRRCSAVRLARLAVPARGHLVRGARSGRRCAIGIRRR